MLKDNKETKLLPEDIKRIGTKLRAIRKKLGFGNSDDFANKHGLDRAQYGKYEAGSQDFRISSLIRVLDKMGYKLSDFFNDEYDETKV